MRAVFFLLYLLAHAKKSYRMGGRIQNFAKLPPFKGLETPCGTPVDAAHFTIINPFTYSLENYTLFPNFLNVRVKKSV